MEKFLNTHEDYVNFILNLSVVAKYIEYEFIIELDNEVSNLVDASIMKKLKTKDDSLIELRLFNIIFENRISVTMKSADISNEYHRIKKVKVFSIIDDKIIEALKTYENFYTIEQEYMSEDYRNLLETITKTRIKPELQEVINNNYYGDVTVSFYDREKKKIIDIYCHEGSYNIRKKYKSLLL